MSLPRQQRRSERALGDTRNRRAHVLGLAALALLGVRAGPACVLHEDQTAPPNTPVVAEEAGPGPPKPGDAEVPPLDEECPPLLQDRPVSVLAGSVLFRPPAGLKFVSDTRASADTGTTRRFAMGCGTTIMRVRALRFDDTGRRPISSLAEDAVRGLAEQDGPAMPLQIEEPTEQSPVNYRTTVSLREGVESSSLQKSRKAYVAATRRHGVFVVFLFEAPEIIFAALLPTFRNSADSLIVIPNR